MVDIILALVFIVIFLALLIYTIVDYKKNNKKETIIIIVAFSLMLIFFCGLSVSFIKGYKYGKFDELVTKYEMKHTGSKNEGTYTKDSMTFEHSDDHYKKEAKYIIVDNGDTNLNLHSYIVNLFFDFEEGTVQTIYEYLKDYANHFEKEAKISLCNNHKRLDIVYNYKYNTIKYTITEVKEYYWVKLDDDNTERKHNSEYEKLYVSPELYIMHYDKDYRNYDTKLLKLLFKKNINEFKTYVYNIEDLYEIGYYINDYCYVC